MTRTKLAAVLFPLALAACTTMRAPSPAPDQPPPASWETTRVLDRAAADRLVNNKGLTLQWISWDTRGSAYARWEGDVLRLTGSQAAANGPGRLHLDGYVSEIGAEQFTFVGTIRMTDTPDAGRRCEANKSWSFAITQNRPYWRLREFEWCDGLTDYIDIYF